MKKTLLLLLFSFFAFGQNVELIQKINKGNEAPLLLAKNLVPEYKLIKTSKIDSRSGNEFSYTYLPNTTSDEKINEYKAGGVNSDAVTLTYTGSADNYSFRSVKGKCSVLLPFWIKEIKPDTKINERQRDSFIYENTEHKIKYYFTATEIGYKNCHFSRIN